MTWLKDIKNNKVIWLLYYNVHLFFRRMGNGCVQHVWFAQNGMVIVRLTRDMHKRAIARIIYTLEKTIYGLKKTIYGLERLFTAQRDYLQIEVISAE